MVLCLMQRKFRRYLPVACPMFRSVECPALENPVLQELALASALRKEDGWITMTECVIYWVIFHRRSNCNATAHGLPPDIFGLPVSAVLSDKLGRILRHLKRLSFLMWRKRKDEQQHNLRLLRQRWTQFVGTLAIDPIHFLEQTVTPIFLISWLRMFHRIKLCTGAPLLFDAARIPAKWTPQQRLRALRCAFVLLSGPTTTLWASPHVQSAYDENRGQLECDVLIYAWNVIDCARQMMIDAKRSTRWCRMQVWDIRVRILETLASNKCERNDVSHVLDEAHRLCQTESCTEDEFVSFVRMVLKVAPCVSHTNTHGPPIQEGTLEAVEQFWIRAFANNDFGPAFAMSNAPLPVTCEILRYARQFELPPLLRLSFLHAESLPWTGDSEFLSSRNERDGFVGGGGSCRGSVSGELRRGFGGDTCPLPDVAMWATTHGFETWQDGKVRTFSDATNDGRAFVEMWSSVMQGLCSRDSKNPTTPANSTMETTAHENPLMTTATTANPTLLNPTIDTTLPRTTFEAVLPTLVRAVQTSNLEGDVMFLSIAELALFSTASFSQSVWEGCQFSHSRGSVGGFRAFRHAARFGISWEDHWQTMAVTMWKQWKTHQRVAFVLLLCAHLFDRARCAPLQVDWGWVTQSHCSISHFHKLLVLHRKATFQLSFVQRAIGNTPMLAFAALHTHSFPSNTICSCAWPVNFF